MFKVCRLHLLCNRKIYEPSNLFAAISTFSKPPDEIYKIPCWDVIISGGGIVGHTAACAIGSSPFLKHLKVLVLDGGQRFSGNISPNYGNRVFSITQGTQQYLNKLGIWRSIERMRVKPVNKFKVWEDLPDSGLDFTNDRGESMSYIIENEVILKALDKKLRSLSKEVNVLDNTIISSYNFPSKFKTEKDALVGIHLNDGTKLTTKFLIGADGYNSLVRKSLEFPYKSWDYKQKAIVATIKHQKPSTNNIAIQRFLKTGPIALLPLNKNTSSLVWTLPNEMADQLINMSDEEFDCSLQTAIDTNSVYYTNEAKPSNGLEKSQDAATSINSLMVVPKSRASFPLHFGHSTHYVACRTALVGDAAHRIHPMAGQGLNLGIGDVECLITNLEKASKCGQDIGSMNPLLDYESERQNYVIPMMMAVDGISNLFTTSFSPLVACRRYGLLVLNNLDPIKKWLVKFYQR